MPEALTPIERRIYNFIIDHLKKETYQPSVREIGSRFGIRSTKTVTEHLQSLQRKGYLDRTPARSRALKILGLDLSPGTYTIPVYANGSIVGEVPDSSLNLDREVACSADCFFVRIRGSHLQDRGIRDGDLILVEPPETAVEGDRLVLDRDGRIEMQEQDAFAAATRDGAALADGYGSAGLSHLDGVEAPRSVSESAPYSERVLGVARALLRRF